jgi:hypothetical protein
MVDHVLEPALMITGFVAIMMLVIEYVNIITRGTWQDHLAKRRWTQYLLGVILGAIPGCMGAFAVVAMFSHRIVTLGALVAAMISTSGDEAFVMLALFPEKALLLTAILVLIGLAAGWLVDRLVSPWIPTADPACSQLEVHEPEVCECFPRGEILAQWRRLSIARGVLTVALLLFLFGVTTGSIGPQVWNWQRFSLLGVGLVGLFVTSTVPEHFLQEHLWRHVALKHVPSIFLWTLGALLVTWGASSYLDLTNAIKGNTLGMIMIAGLVGVVPESGPHLVFTTFYAKGLIPFVVLLTSSIVQDGHGMLPLLAHSRRQFLIVKAINLVVGLVVGLIIYYVGYLI